MPELPEPVAVPEDLAAAAEQARAGGGLLTTFRIDLAPLRDSREFRLLFVGQGVSFFGSMVTYVALPYQAYRISHSSLIVGLLSLAELIPLLITAFVGGALADAVDRRRMVRVTESAMCLVIGVLVVNSLSAHPRLWVLFAVAFAAAGIDGLQRPSLDAMVPRLVSAEQLPAASSLSSLKGSLGMVAGPPVAGVLIVIVGLPLTYGLDVATFFVSLVALALMRAVPPPLESDGLSLRAIADGLRYAKSRQDLLGSYLVDMNAMFFGIPTALLPQVASHLGGAGVLGLLYAAPSAGSLLVALTSGWARRVRRHGRAIALSAGVWGLGIIGFGFADSLALAITGLAVAGAGDMVSGLFRSDDVEPVDPRLAARAPGRNRDAELFVRAEPRQRRSRPARSLGWSARLDRRRGRVVRRGDGRARGRAAPFLELRRHRGCAPSGGARANDAVRAQLPVILGCRRRIGLPPRWLMSVGPLSKPGGSCADREPSLRDDLP